MAKVIFGNHSAVRVPRAEKGRIREFYRDVLGCTITREGNQKDDFRMGDNFYIAFLYEDDGVALDESGFSKAIYLELKAGDVEEMRRKIVAFGVRVLEVPDPHLYFQAPGDRSSGWSDSTRTWPDMRGQSTASGSSGGRLNERANAGRLRSAPAVHPVSG